MIKKLAALGLAVFAVSNFVQLFFRLQFADYDLFARLAVGRLIVRDRAVALQDVFSFSETKEIWYDHEWLFGLLAYQVLDLGGEGALIVLSLASAILTFVFLYFAQQQLFRAPILGVCLLSLAALPSVGIWAAVVRAQTISFLLFSVELFILTLVRKGGSKWLLLILFPLFVVWSNSHGGFFVGIGLLAVMLMFSFFDFWRESRSNSRAEFWALLATSCSVFCAPLLNPYGLGYIEFLYSAIGKERPLIDEWNSLPLNPLEMIAQGHSVFVLFALLMILSVIFQYKDVAKDGLVFCLCALWYGSQHVRLLPFFYCSAAVYFVPALALLLQRLPQARRETFAKVLHPLCILAAIWSVFSLFAPLSTGRASISGLEINTEPYPVQEMQWLSCNYPAGKILSNFNSGSFVLWTGYPSFLVAVDGRYEEVYEDAVVSRVQIALSKRHPDNDQMLDKISPDFIFLCGTQRQRKLKLPWQTVFTGNNCTISAKTPPLANKKCLEKSIWIPRF